MISANLMLLLEHPRSSRACYGSFCARPVSSGDKQHGEGKEVDASETSVQHWTELYWRDIHRDGLSLDLNC
jgi:hypothetical protein